jgi:hypothetical protein
VKVAGTQLTEAFSRGLLLNKAGITCVISMYESNDDMITPHHSKSKACADRSGQ